MISDLRSENPVTVVIRSIRLGRVWAAGPWTLVADEPGLHAAYLAPRTRWWMPPLDGPVGARLRWFIEGGWPLVEHVWRDVHILRLQRPGNAFSVEVWWDLDWQVLHWKVNLELPAVRTRIGLDTLDQTLDVMIAPDFSGWSWKDEAPFAALIRDGALSEVEAAEIRRVGLVAVDLVLAGTSPFERRWADWRPHAAIAPPVLPEGWNECP